MQQHKVAANPATARGKRIIVSVALACGAVIAATILVVSLTKAQAPTSSFRPQVWDDRQPDTERLRKLADGNTAFACDFFRQLCQTPDGNLACSPYSISASLALVYAGARGETKAQLARVLHFELPEPELHEAFAGQESAYEALNNVLYTGNLANAAWVAREVSLNPDYARLLSETYNVEPVQTDFGDPAQAARIINEWTAANTSGNVPEVLTPQDLSGDPVGLVITSCIDFSRAWEHTFREDSVQAGLFHLDETRTVTAQMMSAEGKYQAAVGDGFKVLQLRFQQEARHYSVILLLPDEITGLPAVEDQLSLKLVNDIRRNLGRTDVELSMPKFEFKRGVDAVACLKSLGLRDVFAPELADLSGIGRAPGGLPMCVRTIKHEAYMKVYELGLEASAATAVVICYRGVHKPPEKTMTFNVDHPFLFWVEDDETGAVLFMSRVTNPLEGGPPPGLIRQDAGDP